MISFTDPVAIAIYIMMAGLLPWPVRWLFGLLLSGRGM